MRDDLHNIADGPGAGARIELVVRVLLGTERSTVLVVDLVTGRALSNEVVPHGGEAASAAAAVEAIVGADLAARARASEGKA